MSAVCFARPNCIAGPRGPTLLAVCPWNSFAGIGEDRAILHVLEKQGRLGLDVVTDGELRRGSWLTDMGDAVEGFVPERMQLRMESGPGGGVEGSTAHAAGAKLRKLRKMTGHEVPFLKNNTRLPFKVTLPAPSNFMLASYKAGITEKFYPTHADLPERPGGNCSRRRGVARRGEACRIFNSMRRIIRIISESTTAGAHEAGRD